MLGSKKRCNDPAVPLVPGPAPDVLASPPVAGGLGGPGVPAMTGSFPLLAAAAAGGSVGWTSGSLADCGASGSPGAPPVPATSPDAGASCATHAPSVRATSPGGGTSCATPTAPVPAHLPGTAPSSAPSGSDPVSSKRSIAREALKSTELAGSATGGTRGPGASGVGAGAPAGGLGGPGDGGVTGSERTAAAGGRAIGSGASAAAGGAGLAGGFAATFLFGVTLGLDFATFFPEVEGVRPPALLRSWRSGDIPMGSILGGCSPNLNSSLVPHDSSHFQLAKDSVNHCTVTTGASHIPRAISVTTPSGKWWPGPRITTSAVLTSAFTTPPANLARPSRWPSGGPAPPCGGPAPPRSPPKHPAKYTFLPANGLRTRLCRVGNSGCS
mmetsp:Transcript_117130/g.268926  ORF Transcript_117130/g.268926 Transcript_117130/m.268926 type:complete len:384 (-) Transcript_117130:804-1955(-)